MLNIGGTGTLKPWVKFNSKADKWFVRGPEGGEVEIQRPTFIIDLKNIATGWFRFAQGQAPERRIDPSLEHVAPSPGDGFKRGFVVMCFSPKFFGGAVEMSSASLHLSNSIRDIYAKFKDEEGKLENRGKVPVVACVGSDAMKDKHGLNYRPNRTDLNSQTAPASFRTRARSRTPTCGTARRIRASPHRLLMSRRPRQSPHATPPSRRNSDHDRHDRP